MATVHIFRNNFKKVTKSESKYTPIPQGSQRYKFNGFLRCRLLRETLHPHRVGYIVAGSRLWYNITKFSGRIIRTDSHEHQIGNITFHSLNHPANSIEIAIINIWVTWHNDHRFVGSTTFLLGKIKACQSNCRESVAAFGFCHNTHGITKLAANGITLRLAGSYRYVCPKRRRFYLAHYPLNHRLFATVWCRQETQKLL